MGGKSAGIEEPLLENNAAVAFEIQEVQDGFQRVWSLSGGDSIHQLRPVKQASPQVTMLTTELLQICLPLTRTS